MFTAIVAIYIFLSLGDRGSIEVFVNLIMDEAIMPHSMVMYNRHVFKMYG